MKIAFCVSGIPRSGVGPSELINQDFNRNKKSHHRAFPTADFYYATWNQYEKDLEKHFPNEKYTTFEEPNITYHPFYDMQKDLIWSERLGNIIEKYKTIKDERQNRYQHQTKQILCHAYLIDKFELRKKYDIIVRCRYDTYISHVANFENHCKEIYKTPKAMGFALLHKNNFEKLKLLGVEDNNRYRFLFDSLIIHSSKIFDPHYVIQLDNEKRLMPCEFGWFQTMSMNYGENHECYCGWANADRAIPKNYFKIGMN